MYPAYLTDSAKLLLILLNKKITITPKEVKDKTPHSSNITQLKFILHSLTPKIKIFSILIELAPLKTRTLINYGSNIILTL